MVVIHRASLAHDSPYVAKPRQSLRWVTARKGGGPAAVARADTAVSLCLIFIYDVLI